LKVDLRRRIDRQDAGHVDEYERVARAQRQVAIGGEGERCRLLGRDGDRRQPGDVTEVNLADRPVDVEGGLPADGAAEVDATAGGRGHGGVAEVDAAREARQRGEVDPAGGAVGVDAVAPAGDDVAVRGGGREEHLTAVVRLEVHARQAGDAGEGDRGPGVGGDVHVLHRGHV